jgi:multidrug efflux pump subunit AcrA (membrane-fusion protein)
MPVKLRETLDPLLDLSLDPVEFARRLLAEAHALSRFSAGIVWLLNDENRLGIAAQHGVNALTRGEELVITPQHQERLSQVLRTGQSLRAAAALSPSDNGSLQAYLAPITSAGRTCGIVELFRDEAESPVGLALPPAELAGELAAYASACLTQRGGDSTSTAKFWQQFDRFLVQLNSSLSSEEVAAVAANDGRVILGCDRVSVLVKVGPRVRVLAVSQQESLQRRSNLVQAMTRLAQLAIAGGESLTYTGRTTGWPIQVEQALADYIAESRSRMVRIELIREQRPLIRVEEELPSTQPRRIIGCLMIEQMVESRPRGDLLKRSELIVDHVATALSNARRHESIFLLPLWRTIGRTLGWFRGRRLAIAGAVVLLLAMSGLGLALIPWEYRVEADGLAMPALQHEVFAPWDGDVVEVLIASGERVLAGDPLLIIESDTLVAEHVAAANEEREYQGQVTALGLQLHEASANSDTETMLRLQGELAKARIEFAGAEQRTALLADRLSKLTVVAPHDGVIATFQVEQLLEGRPVQRGELLLEVMEPDGPWRLELNVPEYRMGHVLRAWNALDVREDERSLPVDYIPLSSVQLTLDGRLNHLATRSGELVEVGTVVECFASIDPDELPQRRIGTEVTARIHCGQKSLFYCLFGDVVEFVQRRLWW